MEDQFKKAKAKAEELGLSAGQIKAALKLFAYCENALHVQHYIKDGGNLGMRKLEKKTQPNPFTRNSTDDLFNKFGDIFK